MGARDAVSMSPTEILERFVAAEVDYFASGDDEFPAEELLDPEFVLFEPESMPYGGEWHGPDGFRRFLRVMDETWSTMGPQGPLTLIEHGDTVVVLATLHAITRATQRLVQPPVCQIVRVRDGRLLEARMFYWDTAAITRALDDTPT